MNLDQEIAIQPPPFTDHNNKLVQPNVIRFKTLNISYVDNPLSKTVYAQIQNIPKDITVTYGRIVIDHRPQKADPN